MTPTTGTLQFNILESNNKYGSCHYSDDKQFIAGLNLSPDEYEAAVKEMCRRNGY